MYINVMHEADSKVCQQTYFLICVHLAQKAWEKPP